MQRDRDVITKPGSPWDFTPTKLLFYFSNWKYFPLHQSIHQFHIQEELHSLRVTQQCSPTPARTCCSWQVLAPHPCLTALQHACWSCRKHQENAPAMVLYGCLHVCTSLGPRLAHSIPHKSQILLFILGSIKQLIFSWIISWMPLPSC